MGKNNIIVYADPGENGTYENYSYRASNRLLDNIIQKSGIAESGAIGEDYNLEYTDENGNGITLTGFQFNLLFEFCRDIDKTRKDAFINEYIERLTPENYDKRTKEIERLGSKESPLRIQFNLRELTEKIYGGNCGGYQMKKVREEIDNLSKTVQVMRCNVKVNGEEYILTRKAPLISILNTYEITKKGGGRFKSTGMTIQFDDIFIFEINKTFTLIPAAIGSRLRELGVRTELCNILVMTLLRKRGLLVKDAKKKVLQKVSELKKKRCPNEKIQKEAKRLLEEELTYKESISSILQRIKDEKYTYQTGTRKGKPRTDLIRKNLTQAVNVLKHTGIITSYKETKGSDGSTICNFTFGENWLEEQKEDIQNITETKEDAEA